MRPTRVWADVVLCAGLVVAVVGTFLPWVQSGRRSRNGYATGGVLTRLLDLDGIEAAALRVVPFLALAAAAAVVLVLLAHGLGLPAAAIGGRLLAVLTAGLAGAGASVALAADPAGGVAVAGSGPGATLAGAVLVCTAAGVQLVWSVRSG